MIVYTAIYGAFDAPKPPRPHPRVAEDGWILFTDDPRIYAPGWRVVVDEDRRPDPRMRAKWWKCHPPSATDGLSLYLDGSVRLHDSCLLDAALEALEGGADWACYRHPQHRDLYEEVAGSCTFRKYWPIASKMVRQLASYRVEVSETFDVEAFDSLPVWAAGILARRHTESVLQASADWWRECEEWTAQDQISLPVVLYCHAIEPRELTAGGGLYGNAHFTIEPHREPA